MNANRWYQLGLLSVSMVASMSTWFSAAAILPQLQDRLELGPTATSVLIVAVQLGFVLGAVGSSIANLADRINPRRLVLIGSVGAATANAALLLIETSALAIVARFFVGVFLAVVYPPALKAMSCWFVRGRGLALGILVGAITVGTSSPHLIRSFGMPSWQQVILATSALSLAGGFIAEFVAADGPHPFPQAVFNPKQIVTAFRNRSVRLTTIGYLGHMWELYALWAWIAVFARDVFPENDAAAARMAFGVVAIGALGCVAGGLLSDHWSRPKTAGLSLLISGLAAASAGFLVDQPALVVAVCLVWGFWTIADSAQFSAIVTEVCDQRYVGTALTVQIALGYLITAVTIYLVPFLRDLYDWGWAFMVLVPGPAIGAYAMYMLRPLTSSSTKQTTTAPS